MTKRNKAAIAAAVLAATTVASRAAITVDGALDTGYGAAKAVQTNNSGFGDNPGDGTVGSELDAAYGSIQNGTLYLLLTGNLETNYNHLNIWIQAGTTGQSVSNVNGTLGATNGSKFSPGFAPNYALDLNGNSNTTYVNVSNMNQSPGTTAYLGSFTPNSGSATTLGAISIAENNTNAAGVNGSSPSAADTSAAVAVTTGIEIGIPLSVFGSFRGDIKVLADVIGSNDNYLSNQFLPGLPPATGNLGGNAFDFSATPNQFFTVPAAVGGTNVNGVYNFSTGGSYNTASHWNNSSVPNNPGDTATFGPSITAPSTITLDGPKTLGQITFNSPFSYTIAPGTGGTLTINDTGDSAGVNPLVTTIAGNHTISAPVALTNGVTFATASSTTLTVTGVLSGPGPITHTEAGTLILSGVNTFTGTTLTTLNGVLELDNGAAASAAQVLIGDPTADGLPAFLNVGVAGLTIPNAIVTNQDDSGQNNQRTISVTHTAGTTTFTGALSLDGGVVFTAPTGATIAYAGVIADGQNGASTARHDVSVNSGNVVLSAVNTYDGYTFVNGGTLNVPSGAALASPAFFVNNGASMILTGASNASAAMTVTGTLTINPTTAPRAFSSLNIAAGGVVTVAPAANYSGHTLLTTPSLTLAGSFDAWTAKLDLGNNDLVVNNGDLPTITNMVKNGLSGGQGISSAAAAASTTHLTTLGVILNASSTGSTIVSTVDGQPVLNTDVIVKYTFFGDANLDGKVDGSDYSLLDAGYLANQTSPGSASGWQHGDFNYDGLIDSSDYTLIDNAFNRQRVQLSSAALVASPTALVAPAAVPEPASLALLGLGLLAFRRRRFI